MPTNTYNPDDYAGQPSYVRYQAWLAAGRPTSDAFGRPLDTQGGNITFGFGVPESGQPGWLQSHGSDENDPDRFLYRFAQGNPWAANALFNTGGREYLRDSLQTMTQDDWNAYSPENQGLIRQIWDQWGFSPSWWGAGSPGGNPVGNGEGPPPPPPGWGGAVLGTPPPGAGTGTPPPTTPGAGNNLVGRPKAGGTFTGLNDLSNNMGNSPGQTSPFRISRPGQTFNRPTPRGYQGY